MTNLRLACVAIVKNEQNHVAEWIAYQLAIGFDTVIVFDNQSTDDTAARIRAFAPDHDVRLHEWTMTTPDYQTRCYEHAARSYTDEFDWLAFFDIDEFLVLDPGFDLKSILNLFPAIPAIGVPWAMFGSSGHTEKPDGLLIEAFTHRSEPSFGPNRHIKSIIRPKHMLYCHNAHSFAMDGQYRSLTGKPLTFTQGGLLDTDPDYTLGKLHHYFTRSRAHWADKMQRGYHDTSREDSEFEAYDRNEIPDDSARDLTPRVRKILANLGTPPPQPQPVIASEARQSSPEPSPDLPPRPETKAASPSFLQERSKEPLSPTLTPPGPTPRPQPVIASEARQSSPEPSPNLPLRPETEKARSSLEQATGNCALLTEFGTFLAWSPEQRKLRHQSPGEIEMEQLLLWNPDHPDEIFVNLDGQKRVIDPLTGELADAAKRPSFNVVAGLRTDEIALNLVSGDYVSARPAPSAFEPGSLDFHVSRKNAWECFLPIPQASAVFIANANRRWLAYWRARATQPDLHHGAAV